MKDRGRWFYRLCWSSWPRRCFCLGLVGFVGFLVMGFFWLRPGGLPLKGDPSAYMLARRGQLLQVVQDARVVQTEASSVSRFTLVSDSGLVVAFALKRPVAAKAGARLPLLVIIGGYRTGRDVVDLLPDSDRVMVVGLDYPIRADFKRLKGFTVVRRLPDIRRALYDVTPGLMLVMNHLSARGDIDPERVELVGVSLGAPVVCVAGALDTRFTRVWAVHGGGDLALMLNHNLERKFGVLRRPVSGLGMLLVGTLSPERWVADIAPRPFMMVNADEDGRIPRACVDALFERAMEPKEQIWIGDTHINPKKEDMIRELSELVLARLFEDSPP